MIAIIAALTLAAVSAQSPPALPSSFGAHINLTIHYEGGYVHHTDSVVDQVPNKYAATLTDDGGSTFREAYELVTGSGCLNFEVQDKTCVIGCKGDVPCGGHSCSCGAAYGLFEDLGNAHSTGTCADGSSEFTANIAESDDDAGRPVTIVYCIKGNTPMSLTKTYHGAVPDTADSIDMHVRKLQGLRRITSVLLQFQEFQPGAVDPEVYNLPADCKC